MNLKEAYSILELSSDATPEEAKKKYRELSKKLHPDVNKSPDAEANFKKINEAYQVVSTGKGSDRVDETHNWNPFNKSNIHGFNFTREMSAEIINLSTTISFKESVLGCKKDLKYKRKIKCQDCNGEGIQAINNGCDKCGGRGQVVQQVRGMIMVQTCPKCQGKISTKSCVTCSESGALESETFVNVTVPGGVQNNNILRLSGMGNFAGNFGPLDQYTDVHLSIVVTPEEGLSLQGADVVSTLEISLLEAIIGCEKNVKTIMGDKKINIKPSSRNKDEISIPQLGVNRRGNHRIILDVKYPKDTSKLIDILNEEA